LREELKRRD
jgi:hypothetical protein